jgi:hypothetical protein
MAEIKISDLTPKGANLIATDLLVVSEDIGDGLYETKSITGDEVLNAVAKTAVAVRNTTGATIYKGTIVYISGTSGGKALISKAKADAEMTSSKTLGVVTADIANNANGNVLTNGLLTLLDTRTTATHPFTTDTLVIGDDLYLSPTTAGYVTNVKPIAPNNLVNIGKVLETSATTGQILYAIVNGYELGELHDVDTTGAISGDVLALDGSVWKPTAISSGITIGTTPISSGVAGRVLFEGAGNVVQEDSGLFWDNTNKRLGIGTTTSTETLQIGVIGSEIKRIYFAEDNSALNGAGIGYNASTDRMFIFGRNGGTETTAFQIPRTGTPIASNGLALSQSTLYLGNVDSFHTIKYTSGQGIRFTENEEITFAMGNPATNIIKLHSTGNVGIGTNALAAKLDVKAQGSLSTDIALRVRNSADTSNLFMVKGNGVLNAANLPTSATGLVTGDIWNNLGILTIV